MGAVLIVDDHLPTARVVAALLRSVGHQVACAGGGLEALARIEKCRPDVVVLDVMMPGIGGMCVLRRLRSDPPFTSLPVVMYSALDDGVKQADAMQAGAQASLVKGRADWSEIQATIERHLGAAGLLPKEP